MMDFMVQPIVGFWWYVFWAVTSVTFWVIFGMLIAMIFFKAKK